jgi:hypothetical protein
MHEHDVLVLLLSLAVLPSEHRPRAESISRRASLADI